MNLSISQQVTEHSMQSVHSLKLAGFPYYVDILWRTSSSANILILPIYLRKNMDLCGGNSSQSNFGISPLLFKNIEILLCMTQTRLTTSVNLMPLKMQSWPNTLLDKQTFLCHTHSSSIYLSLFYFINPPFSWRDGLWLLDLGANIFSHSKHLTLFLPMFNYEHG